MIGKNKKKRLIICTCIVFFALLLVSCGYVTDRPKQKYSVGKDTIRSFGDATFQIMKTSSKMHVLFKFPEQVTIESHVYNYKKVDNLVYILGKVGFTIIDLDSYQVKQFRDFNGYSSEDNENYKIFLVDDSDIENLIILNKYDDFNEEEKIVFSELKGNEDSVN